MIRTFIGLVAALLMASIWGAPGAAQSSYGIRAGDQVQVEVLEDPSLNRSVLVLPDGTFSFPMVGTIRAGGRSIEDVRTALTAGLTPSFAAPPNVFVSVASLAERSPQAVPEALLIMVYAMGEVQNPGQIEAEPGLTLLQALAQAGGFTKFAATRRVELRRVEGQRERIYRFDYKKGGGISGATMLQQGDVIVVPERGLFE
ncbi:polysaccharide biosynthesis/export family protein [Actibacterium sp. D379-3]